MSTQNHTPTFPPCELCGSSQVGNLVVTSQYHVGAHPRGKTLWARPLTGLNVVVCLSCGHAKLFANNLQALRNEVGENPQSFQW